MEHNVANFKRAENGLRYIKMDWHIIPVTVKNTMITINWQSNRTWTFHIHTNWHHQWHPLEYAFSPSYVTRRRHLTLLSVKPTLVPYSHMGAPSRATPRRSHLFRTTSGSDPPSHTISLPSALHHISGRFGHHRGFSTKHRRRSSMEKYVLRRKHLLTTPPMIRVPKKLDMGPSRTRPSSARQNINTNCSIPGSCYTAGVAP